MAPGATGDGGGDVLLQLVTVAWVWHDNVADFFTKPLDKKKFQHFRAKLMNETPVSRTTSALDRALIASRGGRSTAVDGD